MEDENELLKRRQEKHEDELLELKRKQQAEIDRLKQEMARIQDQHAADLEEERDQYEQVGNNQPSYTNISSNSILQFR